MADDAHEIVMQTTLIDVDELTPDPANARTHDERNIGTIMASLARFGQRSAIVVQKQGMIVRAGNARLEAAKKLGWKQIAAVVVDEDDLSATAFAIADNRTAELADWDDSVLTQLLVSLRDEDFDVDDIGFSNEDLEAMEQAYNVGTTGMPNLSPDGSSPGLEQITFTFSTEQAKDVRRAVARALRDGQGVADGNPNKNGNALAAVCEAFLAR